MSGPIVVIGVGGQFGQLGSLIGTMSSQHAKEHLEECRGGDLRGAPCLIQMHRSGQFSAAEIGSTPEELEQFRQEGVVKKARQIVEECEAGTLDKANKLVEWLFYSVITEREAGVTTDEADAFVGQYNLNKAREILAACREGSFEHLAHLIQAFREDHVSQEALGLSDEELEELKHQARRENAKDIVAECRNGNFTNLAPLEQAIHDGRLTGQDVEELGIELDVWKVEQLAASAPHASPSMN